MNLAPTILIFATSYVAIMATAFYVCVVADPKDSKLALFWTVTLPRRVAGAGKRLIGRRGMDVAEFIADRLLVLIYCAVVSGAWSVIFFYVYPWIDRRPQYVSSYHKLLGYAVFAACGISWRIASTCSPGIITTRTICRYDHYPYDNLLFVSGKMCAVRRSVPKLARSKYDRFKYRDNVARFDHFCGWVYNTIGEENYRYFLLFLVIHAAMCLYGTYVLCCLFYAEVQEQKLLDVRFVDRYTGEEFGPTHWIIVQYMFHNYLWESGVLMLVGVMAIALCLFLAYHCYLTSFNLTTNEAYKWGQVKQWYKDELKRYQKAVKNGTAVAESSGSGFSEASEGSGKNQVEPGRPAISDDADVTCTPGTNGSAAKRSDQVEPHDRDSIPSKAATSAPEGRGVRHPGPVPRNVYDRGFVENWKEVLFPISLRSDRNINWTNQQHRRQVDSKSKTS
jgi:palmitoyltransferase ZDHHC4